MKTVRIYVDLKSGVLDPKGQAISGALNDLGFSEFHGIRCGKFFDVSVDTVDEDHIRQMCEKLLCNTVIEKYSFEVLS